MSEEMKSLRHNPTACLRVSQGNDWGVRNMRRRGKTRLFEEGT
jgi:hypothetical protein